MSYRINKTNGDLLVDLVDGQIDITSTSLTLVGRNYTGFGEFINENFVKMGDLHCDRDVSIEVFSKKNLK